MLPSSVLDMKAFVPARDPELSKAFYTDLGFTINFSNDEISELQIGFSVPAAEVLCRRTCG
jgi:predicted lactoylglutathione lyase